MKGLPGRFLNRRRRGGSSRRRRLPKPLAICRIQSGMNAVLAALDSPATSWNSDTRVALERRERRGIRLTPGQAARFWNLDAADSWSALEELVAAGVARAAGDGSYVLLPDRECRGDISPI